MLSTDVQIHSNDHFWRVIKRIVELMNADEVWKILSLSVFPVKYCKQFKEAQAIEENFTECSITWMN